MFKSFCKNWGDLTISEAAKTFPHFFCSRLLKERVTSHNTLFLPGEVEKARHISQHTTPVFVIVILKMLHT
jgi:hypothetical protein